MLALWWLSTAWACDPEARIHSAERALITLDLQGASALLDQAKEEFSCAAVSEEALHKYWVLNGVQLWMKGETSLASAHFQAGKRSELSTIDLSTYGEEIVTAYADAPSESAIMELGFATPLGRGWIASVDGKRVQAFPTTAPAGLHLVQIHPKANREATAFAKISLSEPGQKIRFDHALPAQPDSELADAKDTFITIAAGLEYARGTEIAIDNPEVPERQEQDLWVVPLELGIGRRINQGWIRAGIHAGPLLSGGFIFENVEGVRSATFAWGLEVAGGVRQGRFHPGLAAGARLPSRARLRALVGIDLAQGLQLEPSVGVHLLTEGRPEPVGLLSLRYQLSLR